MKAERKGRSMWRWTAGLAVLAATTACASPPKDVASTARQFEGIALAGVKERGIEPTYNRWVSFAGEKLDASAGDNTYSDKTGNCRLAWFDELLRDPAASPRKVEEFTAELHASIRESTNIEPVLVAASRKLDSEPLVTTKPKTAVMHAVLTSDELEAALGNAHRHWRESIAALTADEWAELRAGLYDQSTGGITSGHRFEDREKGRRITDLLEKLDRAAMLRAAQSLTFALRFSDHNVNRNLTIDGVTGAVEDVIETPQGRIIIAGEGDHTYDLDALTDVCMVIDRAGNDTYLEGTLTDVRPVLVVFDLAGNDMYRGEKPGIQGGAILGVSLLVDFAGNDTYDAKDVAQGSALGGVGILIDHGGNDTYKGLRRVQGQAVGGLGLHIDRDGDDTYRAAMLAQGVGGPLGIGILDDLAGDDEYYAGGLYANPYGDSPGFGGFSQGVGVGPRGVANGGIGVLLDGGGDDVYENGYFGHGGGYWFAVGVARDFGGNDKRYGWTSTDYDGGPPTQSPFSRWGLGYGCHYALGFILDDAGDDLYSGTHAGVGFAWDLGVGVIIDGGGNDSYLAPSSGGAQAENAGLAFIFDVGDGTDIYNGSLGWANPKVEYFDQTEAGGNFAWLIDLGGVNELSSRRSDELTPIRGWEGGFLLLPKADE